MNCKPSHLLVLLFALCAAQAADAATPDAARGRVLYEKQCAVCHTPGIHTRREKLPLMRDELRGWVDTFRRQASLGWTPDEIEDVVEYLNQTYYHFPPDTPRR